MTPSYRIADPALKPAQQIAFSFNGAQIDSYEGETIVAALAAAGVVELGRRRDGTARGVFCGMGVCQDCLVTVDGVPSRRACMEKVVDGSVVTAQDYAVTLPRTSTGAQVSSPCINRPQVLIVGAGPSGLAAARAAALCGAAVTVIDERATPGGQYFKQFAKSHVVVNADRLDPQMREGRKLIAAAAALGVTIVSDAAVWGAFVPLELAATVAGARRVFVPERLVLATGVYERGVPMPGWTLPGYVTTGAAQTSLRAYRVAPGRRVLVAGNGPLNFQLAAELVAAGVDVVAVVEAAPRPGARQALDLLRAARAAPGLIANGLGYLARLHRNDVPILYGSAVMAAQGTTRVESCTVARIDACGRPIPQTAVQYPVDTVCAGYGFLPSNEIARALGCRHRRDPHDAHLATTVDVEGLTSIPGVYAIGDAVAFRGAHAGQCQGFVTGCAVAQSLGLKLPPGILRELDAIRRRLTRHWSFQRALWQLFAAPLVRDQLAERDTIVCRCEHVARAAIEDAVGQGATSLGEIKRRTRAGMGRCQGRYCESIVAAMVPESQGVARDELFWFSPRAPIKPIRIKDLA